MKNNKKKHLLFLGIGFGAILAGSMLVSTKGIPKFTNKLYKKQNNNANQKKTYENWEVEIVNTTDLKKEGNEENGKYE